MMWAAVEPKTRLRVLSTALLSISSYLSVFLTVSCSVILSASFGFGNNKRVLRFNKPLRLSVQHKYTTKATLPRFYQSKKNSFDFPQLLEQLEFLEFRKDGFDVLLIQRHYTNLF